MSWILTESGKRFDFLKPGNPIDIQDIAGALSKICRFTGHTNGFYSVASHSVLVSHMVPGNLAFEALMHDAHEAYIGDVSSPLKSLLPEYKAIERRVEAEVRQFFGLPIDLNPIINVADKYVGNIERSLLLPNHPDWPAENFDISLVMPQWPGSGRSSFIARYHELRS